MRKMLLSFKADVYEKVLSGEKIFQHRKVFPNEPVKAYLYVSNPQKAITGIMYLENKKQISDWLEEYKYDSLAIQRVEKYLETQKVVMQITKFQPTNEIPLEQLRNELSRFVVPQMYYFIEGTELETYLERELHPTGKIIEHDFSNITSSMICVH